MSEGNLIVFVIAFVITVGDILVLAHEHKLRP